MVQTVSDANAPATVYWRGDNSNAWGQLTKETLGNGVVSNRTFDAVTSWLSSIESGIGSDTTSVQGHSYLYDLVGNVTQRQNDKLMLTETFHYGSPTDNLYRLEHSTVSNDSTSLTNLSLTYDLSGSILTKNEVDMPDRLVAQSICWTSYNYPSRIVVGNESTSFSYGPSRQRWRMSYASNVDPNAVDCNTPLNATETTLYIGGMLEKVTSGASIRYRHSIAGGNGGVVALYTRTGSDEELRYVFEDNLGSAETFVEDGVGTVTNASFTAYGLRRNAQTWAGEPLNRAALDNITRQGYTYQTALGSMGLNHMNGRVQDAAHGRFLSADPYVTYPYYTQSYNRYAYVTNNPLTFIDPSGFNLVPPECLDTLRGCAELLSWWTDVGGHNSCITPAGGMLTAGACGYLSSSFGSGGVMAQSEAARRARPNQNPDGNNDTARGAVEFAAGVFVPGWVASGEAAAAFSEGRYGSYAGWTVLGAGEMLLAVVTAGESAAVIGTARVAKAAATSSQLLYRYRNGAESVTRLTKGATDALKKIGVHGVSVTTNPITGRACGVACREAVEKVFPVVKTGGDPNHFTVVLPNPVTREVADQFNALFQGVP
jgi:RHS repeat-associated protein